MAELPEIAGVSRVAFKWGPMIACNVMHFHQEVVEPEGLFGAIDANLQANMWACIPNTQRVLEVDITPLDGFSGTQTFLPPVVAKWKGLQGGNAIPAQAAVVKKTTVARGRSNRGRTYVGPTAENITDGGTLDPTIPPLMATAWQNFQVAMSEDGAEEVVASYKNATAFTVLLYSVRQVAGTMRLRQSRLAHS